jgi:ABC-type Mn2+/Zn2+ transport system permease subunit
MAMSERLYTFLIRAIIAGMFIGIFGMIQPWSLSLFKPGFLILLYSTLAYTVLSHLTPREGRPSGEES